MSEPADWHEDRDSAWLLGLADAVAAEMGIDRTEALTRMAIVFGAAAFGEGELFGTQSRNDLHRASRLCEHLAAPPAAVEVARAGGQPLPGMEG
jgi:hypothetical protein